VGFEYGFLVAGVQVT